VPSMDWHLAVKSLDQKRNRHGLSRLRLAAGDLRFATSVETHGLDCGPYETFNEEFIVCRECGGRYDICEWDGTQELGLRRCRMEQKGAFDR
jgi:hypothetical protein